MNNFLAIYRIFSCEFFFSKFAEVYLPESRHLELMESIIIIVRPPVFADGICICSDVTGRK